jgi:NodT family efflux transporter outer membrane factor (OMF) lipoprotein
MRQKKMLPSLINRLAHLFGIVAFLLTSGCLTVGPDYVAPEVKVPDAWQQKAEEGLKQGPADIDKWWDRFNDPVLTGLIAEAREENLDLKSAVASLEEAMALRGVAASAYYGNVDADGAVLASRASEGTAPIPPGGDPEYDYYTIGGTASWEIDAWGRVRRSVESASASLNASLENYRDILVLLESQVAGLYVDIRTTQKQIRLTEENVNSQRSTMQLTVDRFDAGLAADLDVRRAELNLAITEAALPALYTRHEQLLNSLSVLLGEMPGSLLPRIGNTGVIPVMEAPVYAGLPAELLRQRPDIRAAERNVAAQNARIGVATSEWYPRFQLIGDLRLESTDYDNLFEGSSLAYAFGPQVRWNLFNGGRIRNQVRAEQARTDQTVLIYEKTVLTAVQEVETSMVGYAQEQDRSKILERAVKAAAISVDQTQTLYKSGLTDFQNVLNMERDLFQQENALAASEGKIALSLIDLFRSLGGGWQDAPQPAAAQ